jgi:hypothetical protein|tara:strand:+ start:846 stop:1043 length:198 start_codon:yes stop_codon:yes gene_type:complete
MSKQHYEFIADLMGPMVAWPSHLNDIADALEKTNPKFVRKKFLDRATKAWEDNNNIGELDDEIRY